MCVCVCVRGCVCVCGCGCVRACVRACQRVGEAMVLPPCAYAQQGLRSIHIISINTMSAKSNTSDTKTNGQHT